MNSCTTAQISCFSIWTMAPAGDQETRNLLRNSLVSDATRAVVFITFPGRTMRHDALRSAPHERLAEEADAENVITLRTNVSVPRAVGASAYVQRQLWFKVVDPDAELTARNGSPRPWHPFHD